MARSERILPMREAEEYRCNKCKRVDSKPTNFYKSYSLLYDNGGYMPICKDCLSAMYNKYILEYKDVYKAIKRICMMYDLFYKDSIVDACMSKKKGTPPIGDYMRQLNIVQNKGKSFDNTLVDGFLFDSSSDSGDDDEHTITTVSENVRMRWGSGFTDADYKLLEEHYKLLKKANPEVGNNQEIFIMDLCRTETLRVKAFRNNDIDNYAKLSEQYRKTFTQSGLKTIVDATDNNDDTWGTWIGYISKYTPEEYYKDKTLYKNFGNIGDYFKRFLLRPLKNLQFGTTDRDEEYFVSDEEQ